MLGDLGAYALGALVVLVAFDLLMSMVLALCSLLVCSVIPVWNC